MAGTLTDRTNGALFILNDIGGHHNTPSEADYWNNSLTYCTFATGLTDKKKLDLLNAATGYELKYPEDWNRYGLRFMLFARSYNIREGYGGIMPPSKADILPKKAFKKLAYGAGKDQQLTLKDWLEGRLRWYRNHGCDEKGVPTRDTLKSLGLEFVISEIEKADI